ncbi:MAG: hypothetical protein HQM15_05445 [Deltaproteobacteria bacterium]|nr:hypothetical protein [Deltaproteobacteria bacterium]
MEQIIPLVLQLLSGWFFYLAILFAFLFFLYHSITIVGGTQIAIVERRWLGRKIPEGRVVAMSNEVGMQARVLGPGLHLLIPFLYRVQKMQMTQINENEVGIVDSIDGEPVHPGKIFSKVVEGHNLFQDAEAFLKNGGEKGPQIQILPPGLYRINPYMFKVEKVKAISIPNNQVGVMVAVDGLPIAPGRLLARRVDGEHNNFQNGQAFLESGGQKGPQIDILLPGTYRINTKLFNVGIYNAVLIPSKKIGLITAKDGEPLPPSEYVAKAVVGHKDFQDSAAFLSSGGQRGPQLDFLKPGTYYINPLMFDVMLDDFLQVQRGEVAVIVSNIGKDPSEQNEEGDKRNSEERLKSGVERYVVDAGYRGIQREVLGPGSYYLNKQAYTHHLIPTTNITIDWAGEKPELNTPRIFNPLSIVSKDGFEMTVEVKVIFRVLPEQAPHMVARIGTIDNLIEHVIHPLIDSSFRNQASSSEAMKFLQDRYDEQKKAEQHVNEELKKYHVECVSVLICQIVLPERLMQTLTSKVVASQQKSMFDAQQEAEGRRKEMEKTKAEADLQPNLVKAEIDVQIASQQKNQQIILAEGKSQSTRLEQEGVAAGIQSVGKAEGEKVLALGQATAEAYRLQLATLGASQIALIEIIKQISAGQIKIIPEILIQGGAGESNSSNMLTAFLSNLMSDDLKGKADKTVSSKKASA